MRIPETAFVNEMRLSPRNWAVAATLVLLVILLTPRLWERVERFETGPDYRLPYELSKDYWLYQRRLRQVLGPPRSAESVAATPADYPAATHPPQSSVLLLGDSVIWGEYVLPDGTLSHFLSRAAGQPEKFINGGVNGLFPLALEGLVRHYGGPLQHRRVLLHCNVLWMSSPKADLQTDKEERFNHARLVPQFLPRIPCYRADANERLNALVERNVAFVSWVNHLQNAYFGQKSVPQWTLQEEGGDPPRYPNSWRNPLAQIALTVPSAPKADPQRGPGSSRHRPWREAGNGPSQFEWVALDTSLQWQAFQRLVTLLRARGNDVLVLVGPFNEHIITAESQPAFRRLRDGIVAWLTQNQIPYLAPDPLPSEMYADASHPLTEGYELLAKRIYGSEPLQKWLRK